MNFGKLNQRQSYWHAAWSDIRLETLLGISWEAWDETWDKIKEKNESKLEKLEL